MASDTHSDAVVLGGGAAGCLTALLLAKRGWSCTLYAGEAVAPPDTVTPPDTAHVVALFPASMHALRQALQTPGCEGLALPEGYALRELVIGRTRDGQADAWNQAGTTMRFASRDFQRDVWGWVVSHAQVVQVLREAAERCDAINVRPVNVADIHNHPATNTNAATVVGTDGSTCQGRMVVIADGGRSRNVERAGIPTRRWQYHAQIMIGMLRHPPIANNHTSREWHSDGRCLTLVPVSPAQTGLLWLGSPPNITALAGMSGLGLAERVRTALEGFAPQGLVVDRVEGVRWRPLGGVWSGITNHRCVAVGDAAHGLPPIAAQGFNLTVDDAVKLAEAVGNISNVSNDALTQRIPQVLAAYGRARRRVIRPRLAMVDCLARGTLHAPHVATWLLNQGEGLIKRSDWWRRAVVGVLSLPDPRAA